jgi:hypothetical protein
MAKSANPLQATANDPQAQDGGDRDGGQAAAPPAPQNPVDPNNNPPTRGGDPVS